MADAPSTEDILKALVIERDLPLAKKIMADAVEASFDHCPMRNLTRDEIKRRLVMACEIFVDLRAEMRYTLDRIEAVLGTYLVYRIEGQRWEPLKRRTWVPGQPISLSLPQLPDVPRDRELEHALRLSGVRID